MTSVVPERALRRPSVHPSTTPLSLAERTVAADTRWLRRLGRRLLLLDAVIVTVSLGTALGFVFGPRYQGMSIGTEWANIRPSSYLVLGPALAVAWTLFLLVTRTYDGRILGVGGDEYRRVVRASVYFWGLVAVACYKTQFQCSRLAMGLAFVIGAVLLLLGRWSAR
ncbi:MAG: hypothetical protein ACRDV2_16145 [Actinomycetes bacterium]